eukprot:symbB.v1.2.021230.t1/scaffold1818.1/size102009/4
MAMSVSAGMFPRPLARSVSTDAPRPRQFAGRSSSDTPCGLRSRNPLSRKTDLLAAGTFASITSIARQSRRTWGRRLLVPLTFLGSLFFCQKAAFAAGGLSQSSLLSWLQAARHYVGYSVNDGLILLFATTLVNSCEQRFCTTGVPASKLLCVMALPHDRSRSVRTDGSWKEMIKKDMELRTMESIHGVAGFWVRGSSARCSFWAVMCPSSTAACPKRGIHRRL